MLIVVIINLITIIIIFINMFEVIFIFVLYIQLSLQQCIIYL